MTLNGDFNSEDRLNEDRLTWESTYAIARALLARFPEVHLEEVSLGMIYRWTLALPGFEDEPELANDSILLAIYQDWYEELNPL